MQAFGLNGHCIPLLLAAPITIQSRLSIYNVRMMMVMEIVMETIDFFLITFHHGGAMGDTCFCTFPFHDNAKSFAGRSVDTIDVIDGSNGMITFSSGTQGHRH